MLKQVLAVLVLAGVIEGASIEKAKMLNTHGLKDSAKQELIDVIYGASGAEAKADAYYYLGNIALTERKVTVAISTWNELVKKHPNSKRVVEVQQQIEVLRTGLSDTLDVVLENITAQLYLRNADFWLKNLSTTPQIDGSGLPLDEVGLKWLDKVIAEFPGTAEAEKAYKYKLFFLITKAKTLSDSKSNNEFLGKEPQYEIFIETEYDKNRRAEHREKALIAGIKLITVKSNLRYLFDEFEATFPESSLLQMFRFQIAQLYMKEKNFEAADQWLNTIIEVAGEGDSFYKQLAQYRLKNR